MAGLALTPEVAVHSPHEFGGDGESETGLRVAGDDPRWYRHAKQALLLLMGQTRSGVADAADDIAWFRHHLHVNRTVGRRRLHGVGKEIVGDHRDAYSIAPRHRHRPDRPAGDRETLRLRRAHIVLADPLHQDAQVDVFE